MEILRKNVAERGYNTHTNQIKMFASRRWLILILIVAVCSFFIIHLAMTQYRPIAHVLFLTETFNQAVSIDLQRVPIDNQTVAIDQVIQLQRREILQEMENFEYPSGRFGVDAKKLSDLTPETGGNPVRSVIITTWRSGSTFLGDILNAMPGNYYHYEPLLSFKIRQIRGPPNDTKAIRNLKKFLNCDYSDMDEYLEQAKKFHNLLIANKRLWKQYQKHPEFFWKPTFLTPYCKLFPLQSMKVVRLRLALAEQLLDDTSLNVRILLLVRDPRGTMQSRKHRDWCPSHPDCYDASYLCEDLVSDYYAAEILYKKYPSRFKTVRYEDLSISVYEMSQMILQFFGLPFDNLVKEFLDTHTNENKGGVSSTFRDSKTAPFHWITDLQWQEVEEIENKCTKAMDLWGYRKMNTPEEQNETFEPVLPAPFT